MRRLFLLLFVLVGFASDAQIQFRPSVAHSILDQKTRIRNYDGGIYPTTAKNVAQITSTGNPDYYAFGSLIRISKDQLIYIAKLGPDHINGTGIWLKVYTASTGSWGATSTILTTGDADIYSGVSAGIIGNSIFVHVAKYNVAGDEFTDIGYIKSTDLTGTSWGSYTSFGATTYERFEAYGKIVQSTTAGKYFMMWFEHLDGGSDPWRLNIRKTTNSGTNWTDINVVDGVDKFAEPSLLHVGGTNYIIVCRNQAGSPNAKLHLFYSDDDCETWANVGVTNLGAGTGQCVVDTWYSEGMIHVIWQDRGTGNIRISKNTSLANALLLNFSQPYDYWDNNNSDSLNGLGYPSVVVLRNPDIVYLTWCKETSTGEAHVYGTLDTIDNIPNP